MCCCKTCCKCECKKPKIDEKYWFVGTEGTLFPEWNNGSIDIDRFQFGNFFPTKEKAEEAAEKIKELLKSL